MRRLPDTPLIAPARRKLQRWPSVVYVATPTSLHIPRPAPGGFDIRLESGPTGHRIRFDGWRRTFDRTEDAVDCLELGLSESCRLAVTCRGRTPVAWALEVREFGMWAPHRPTRRRVIPFWRRARMEYRQNRGITRAAVG